MNIKLPVLHSWIFSVIITLIGFGVCYHWFGIYFVSYENVLRYYTTGLISDINTPWYPDDYFLMIHFVAQLQQLFPDIPMHAVFCSALLFIPIHIYIFYIISYDYKQWINRIVVLIIVIPLLFDNVINIHNSRISILFFGAYYVLMINLHRAKYFMIALPVLILASLIRVEYTFLFICLFIVSKVILQLKLNWYKVILSIAIPLLVHFLFLANFGKEDIYLKTNWDLERSFVDMDNLKRIDSNSVDYQKKLVYQKAITFFISDRNHIEPDDYYDQLEFPTIKDQLLTFEWIEKYLNNIEDSIDEMISTNEYVHFLLPFYLLLFILLLPNKISFRQILLANILISVPFVIMLKSSMPLRFLIPYIQTLLVVMIIMKGVPFKSIRWLMLVILIPLFLKLSFIYENEHSFAYRDLHRRNQLLNIDFLQLNQNGIIPVISHPMLMRIYDPVAFSNPPKLRYYLLYNIYYTFYNTFKNKKAEYFKEYTSLQAVIEQISNDPNLIFLSDKKMTDIIKKYILYFYEIDYEFIPIRSINRKKNINYYLIKKVQANDTLK